MFGFCQGILIDLWEASYTKAEAIEAMVPAELKEILGLVNALLSVTLHCNHRKIVAGVNHTLSMSRQIETVAGITGCDIYLSIYP